MRNQQQNYVYGISILEIRIAKLIVYIQLFAEYILWFFFVPLYAISRIFNLLIPIIGMILIPKFSDITFFQWTLTALFFLLFIGLLILFPSVWEFQFLAWHVAPGYSIISPKIHSDNNEDNERPSTPYLHEQTNDNDEDVEEEEHTTTLEEILSDRSSAMSSNIEDDEDEEQKYDIDQDNNDENKENDVDSGGTNAVSKTKRRAGPRRQRRIRRKHKRQQKKQKKNKLKKIREKIRKYEKLDFYEWVKEFYFKCCSIPMIRNRINEKFGADIGRIILSYLPTINDEDVEEEEHTTTLEEILSDRSSA